MRFTRPGARPRHVVALETPQLRGSVLGARIEYECPGAKLRAGQVLQLVPASVGWIELDVKMVVRPAAARRFLVHRHHVGQRYVKQAVVLLKHALENSRERFAVLWI